MLARLYVEALLVDENLADQVWDAGVITDGVAAWAWCMFASHHCIRGNSKCGDDYSW